MPRPVVHRARPVRRAVIGAVLVVAAVVMGGLPALAAAGPTAGASGMAGMEGMDGMAAMHGMAVGTAAPASSDGPGRDLAVLGCEAMCGDLLSACLAVLVLGAASAMAVPSVGRIRAGPCEPDLGEERRWAGGSPPRPVLSLLQLSVLRV